MRALKILGAIAAAIIIPGGIIGGVTFYMLTKICYNIYDLKIKDVNPKTVVLELILEVKNPSKVNIKIEGYDINVLLNTFLVANIKSKAVKVLAAEAVSYLVIPVVINHQEVYGAVRSKELLTNFLLKQYDKINVSLDGKFLGEAAKIPVSTNVKLNYTLAEILKMKNEPSVPCNTGRVKRVKKLNFSKV